MTGAKNRLSVDKLSVMVYNKLERLFFDKEVHTVKRVGKIRRIRYYSAVPLFIFGLFMVVLPGRSLSAVSTVAGAICSMIGLVELFLFLTEAKIRYRLILGVLGAVLGTLFITVRNDFVTLLLQLIIGILIIVDGIYKVRLSLEICSRGGRLWGVPLALAIVMAVMGALVIFWNEESALLPLFFGLAILFNSAGELVVGLYSEPYAARTPADRARMTRRPPKNTAPQRRRR